MSKFSEKCKEIMAENGTNVYRLSNTSSLERTTLQRMVTGKRLPHIEFVKQFCRELRIPISTEKELMELYKIETVGEQTYQNRKCIENLLRVLEHPDPKPEEITVVHQLVSTTPPHNFLSNFQYIVYDTELKIFTLLEKAFSSPSASTYIYTNFPVEQKWFLHFIKIMSGKYPDTKLSIQHLINFQINASLTSQNLEILCTILPWALSNVCDYTPRYRYSKLQTNDISQLLFPYFIIIPGQVLTVSGDLTHTVLHTDPTTVDMYMKEYEKISALSLPLFSFANTPANALSLYLDITPPPQEDAYVLEYSPCFFLFSTPLLLERIKKKYPREYPILEKNMNLFTERKYKIFSALNGLTTFCKTQILHGQMGTFFSPFTVEECILGLTNSLKHHPFHTLRFFVDEFHFSPNTCIEIYGRKQLNFMQIDDSLNVSLFIITESSICEAFYDFASSLETSEYILSEEISSQIIKQHLTDLKIATSQSENLL